MTTDPSRKTIVVLGMITNMPVAGVVWQTMHYLEGFRRLGYDVYYVEAHARTPSMLMTSKDDNASARAVEFLAQTLGRFDFADRWAFLALHDTGEYHGLTERQVLDVFDRAEWVINLHGGTIPRPEHCRNGRLIYVETDPVDIQIELANGEQETIDFLRPHQAFFTFGENYGQKGCRLPVTNCYTFHPTRQPVICDFWSNSASTPGTNFTTIGNWKQTWREITFRGEVYHWSKHFEFLKFLDLPTRTEQRFELALANINTEDRKQLEGNQWIIRESNPMSWNFTDYRRFILTSRGEFTVAKDQNVRLATGWFSDRSATYLAAGRPVITQDTGFGQSLPTGEGLFSFSTVEDILDAVDKINSDVDRHRRAAVDIAHEYFAAEKVLGSLLARAAG